MKKQKYGMLLKKSHEEFTKEIKDLVDDEYTFMEEYKNNYTHLLCRHNICGHEWKTTPNNFISNGSRCPKCNSTKKTHEEFIQQIEDLVGDEYTFLGMYERYDIKMLCRHNVCGHEWGITPNNFISNGSRCPKCNSNKKTNEEFAKEVRDLVGNEYTFLEKYIRSDIKILCRHNVCGHEWYVIPNNFLNVGSRCPKC